MCFMCEKGKRLLSKIVIIENAFFECFMNVNQTFDINQ